MRSTLRSGLTAASARLIGRLRGLPRISIWLAAITALMLLGQAPAAAETLFIETTETFSSNGNWWYQGFRVRRRTTFILRVATDYAADTAIVTASQLSAFTQNGSFRGYGVFDNRFGTAAVTLNPGQYYLGIRNQVNGPNTVRVELDLQVSLPRPNRFYDYYLQGASYVAANGGWYYHPFVVQTGARYFLDGCNSGLETYVIPASEIGNFTGGRSFLHYPTYAGTGHNLPGLYELRLNPGNYALAFRNPNGISKAVTYTMERWLTSRRKRARARGSAAELRGAPQQAPSLSGEARRGSAGDPHGVPAPVLREESELAPGFSAGEPGPLTSSPPHPGTAAAGGTAAGRGEPVPSAPRPRLRGSSSPGSISPAQPYPAGS